MALVNFVLLVEEKLKENKVNLNLLNFLMDQIKPLGMTKIKDIQYLISKR